MNDFDTFKILLLSDLLLCKTNKDIAPHIFVFSELNYWASKCVLENKIIPNDSKVKIIALMALISLTIRFYNFFSFLS